MNLADATCRTLRFDIIVRCPDEIITVQNAFVAAAAVLAGACAQSVLVAVGVEGGS